MSDTQEQDHPGTFFFEWNAKDDDNHDLSSGVYFVRVSLANKPLGRVVPVVLVK